jgi:hypothetical protein
MVRQKAVTAATAPVLGITAAGFAEDIREHERQITRLQDLLLGFDRGPMFSPHRGRAWWHSQFGKVEIPQSAFPLALKMDV